MSKTPGKVITSEEIMAVCEPTNKPRDLHQCPCEPACKCDMLNPCLGCETYSEWLGREGDNG